MKPLEWELTLVFRSQEKMRDFIKELIELDVSFTYRVSTGHDRSEYWQVDIDMSYVTNLEDVVLILSEMYDEGSAD